LPALKTDNEAVLTHSMATCEWLDETHSEPLLLPGTAIERARIRAFAQAIACDIRQVQNLKVLARLHGLSFSEEEVTGWARWVIQDGLDACEALRLRSGRIDPDQCGRADPRPSSGFRRRGAREAGGR
jgi:maleylpyruvate isomerase